ncbi:hypothetical protein V5O48_001208 [Marasmius crinis-equi]|uniref:F-box domain-containing protein n=1 Tax=Marasmius crinis-equi TaxID=585013 RepID=A0ABR3FZJ0_9AGAR
MASLPPAFRTHTCYSPLPSEGDKARLLECLATDERILERCREEMHSLTERLAKFEIYTTNLQKRINQHRFIVSSIRKVPPEIWSQIFFLVCSVPQHTLFISREHPVQAPATALSHVCPRWREIVCASPRLWSSLDVDIHQPSEGHQNIVEMYLRNSGKHPLKLRIVDSKPQLPIHSSFHPVGATGLAVFRTLIGESARIQELDAEFDGRMLDLIKDYPTVTFPILSSFRNAVSKQPDVVSGQWFWDGIQKAPFKHAVSGYYYPPILPYSQLTSLVCETRLEATMVMECFQRFPPNNLISLTFQDISVPSNMRNLIVPVTLPALEHLTLKTTSSPSCDALSGVLECLTLPSLKSLELQSNYFLGFDDVPSFPSTTRSLLAMIRRSECSLEKLSLNVSGVLQMTDTPLTQVLEATPDLSHLGLYSLDLHENARLEELLSSLTIPESTSSCHDWPVRKLSKLSIEFYGSNPDTPSPEVVKAVRKMHRSRREASDTCWKCQAASVDPTSAALNTSSGSCFIDLDLD